MSASAGRGEVFIYDEIGSWGLTAKAFADGLKGLGKLNELTVRINSSGGDVFDGVSIFNLLKARKENITVEIDGAALSIASVIAMAGDEIRMAKNAFLMIHEASGLSIGTAVDMRKTADLLDQVTGTIARTYADRTGSPEADVRQLMANETWMDSAEALARGFIDVVGDANKIAACGSADRFKNVPDRFRGRFGGTRIDKARLKIAAYQL